MLLGAVMTLAGVVAAASETIQWGEMAHLKRILKVKRLNNGLARTPQLGWNGWNMGACNAGTAKVALDAANAFVKLGLKDAGYEYVNIDDCWSTKQRNSSGFLVADPQKWPSGVKAVADQIHGMGLKFGLYGSAGTKTCEGYPGSRGYEDKDAQLLVSWGVDYWKYDNCYVANGQSEANGSTRAYYPTMRDALQKTGKTLFFSLCQWGRDQVWTWGKDVGNSWRTSTDNWNDWASVVRIASHGATISQWGSPGGWNDLDMMQINNGKLTEAEERTHWGLWILMKSPIILGTDINKLNAAKLNMVKHRTMISMLKDSLGKGGTTFSPPGVSAARDGVLHSHWYGELSDGMAVGLVAPSGATTWSLDFKNVPGLTSGVYAWEEMFTGRTGNGSSVSFSLASHDMAFLKITVPSSSAGAVTPSTAGTEETPTDTPTGAQQPAQQSNTPTSSSASGCIANQFAQCGGINWKGCVTCEPGSTCGFVNDYYSQCLYGG